mmetsp:Transcript_72452/g.156661  ORF Transcript_72452/g.156661 Transcript_72452/m.156661 type:complete len:454 (+) Transcript_72452:1318-2679(+)
MRHRHGVEDLGIDGFLLEIDQVHLLADAHQGRLGGELRQVRAHEAVRVRRDVLELHVGVQLHVLGLDAQDLQAAVVVGNADVQLAVEAAEAAEGRIDGVRPVRRTDDDRLTAALHAIHEREHLGHHALLHLAVGLVTLRRDRIDLVDEDDRRRVLLGLLEGAAQVRLGLASHLGHDLRAVDEEEEGTRLVRHSACDERLAAARGPVQKHAAGGLHAQRLEESRMAQGQLDHLADLGHGLLAAANVVITNIVQLLLILAVHRLALAVDHRVRGDDDELTRIDANDLELDRAESTTDKEQVALPGRTVGLQEVGLQVGVEEVACDALDRVVNGQDVDALAVRHISAGVHRDDVAQTHAEVLAHHLVHADLRVIQVLVREHDADGVLALLALDEHVVAAEEVQLLHLGLREGDDRVVIVERLLHDQAVRGALLDELGRLRRRRCRCNIVGHRVRAS